MHKASPVELRTSIEMAHSLAQIGVRFVPIPVETDEEFHTLATSLRCTGNSGHYHLFFF